MNSFCFGRETPGHGAGIHDDRMEHTPFAGHGRRVPHGYGPDDMFGEPVAHMPLRCMPRGYGPGRPGGPGFPPGGGMPPFNGRPPRRPDPAFLKRRIEESDLSELIDMAGRMQRRRPQGSPARGQALILSILAGRDALSQRELQQMLGIQPGSLSELLSKLEAKGLLTREKAEDRRGNLLRITDAGRAAIPTADSGNEEDPFAPLTAEQQDRLADMLRTLLTAWTDQLQADYPGSDGQMWREGERHRWIGPSRHDERPIEL